MKRSIKSDITFTVNFYTITVTYSKKKIGQSTSSIQQIDFLGVIFYFFFKINALKNVTY